MEDRRLINNKQSARILTIIFLTCVFLLSLIKIEDTDTWTHLSLGRLIFSLKGFPEHEQFNFPSLDKPFYNPEWLFGVIFYIAYSLFDIYGVILLKAIVITSVFYILLKDSLIPHKNHLVSIAVLIFIVFMIRHRFVERPDIVLMLFLGFTIFSLNAFIYENRKYLYFVPLIQIFWANMHPSIILMPIPFIAFLCGGILQRVIRKRYPRLFPDTPSAGQLKTISIVFLLSLLTSFLNPYFLDQFILPFKLAASDWWRDEIMELQPPDWQNFKSPYLLLAALIVSFLINIRRISIIHLLLLSPFVYLSFSAIRFIFLLGLIGGPLISRNIGELDLDIKFKKPLEYALVFFVVLFTSLTLLETGPFYMPTKKFGFGINYDFFPEKALRFLDEAGINGRVFNTFEWGGYIIWRDFPKRIPFVDGRGGIGYELLNKLDLARNRASVLDSLYKKYGFDVILINYPRIPIPFTTVSSPDIDMALASKDWALVYWDDLSLVYLKKDGKYKDVVKQYTYRYVKPANGPYSARIHDKEYMSELIKELERNIKETGSSTAYAFLGFILNEMGLYNEALKALSNVRDTPFGSNLYSAYQGIAFAYGQMGYYDEAIRFYKKALKIKREAPVLYNLGIIYIKNGDEKKGAEYLEKALELNKNLLSIYPKLISIYKKFNKQEELNRIIRMYEAAKIFNTGEEHFQKALKAFLERRYEDAIEEYKKSIEANPYNPSAHSNLGYIYFDLGLIEKAYEYQKNAINLDPEFANAHYGLALIYKRLGDREGAIRHWQEYLRIEPKGYYARKAKEELRKLRSSHR